MSEGDRVAATQAADAAYYAAARAADEAWWEAWAWRTERARLQGVAPLPAAWLPRSRWRARLRAWWHRRRPMTAAAAANGIVISAGGTWTVDITMRAGRRPSGWSVFASALAGDIGLGRPARPRPPCRTCGASADERCDAGLHS